jgi:hypothetical protein
MVEVLAKSVPFYDSRHPVSSWTKKPARQAVSKLQPDAAKAVRLKDNALGIPRALSFNRTALAASGWSFDTACLAGFFVQDETGCLLS